MKSRQIVLFLFTSLISVSGSAAQKLDWQAVQGLEPNTRIWVKAHQQTYCYFEQATDDKLFCAFLPESSSSHEQDSDLVFDRMDVREVHLAPHDGYDSSKGFLSLLLAAGGGGGWDSDHQPNAFAGVKIGGTLSLDLQYDRIQGHNGFSTEGSAVLPAFRVPGYHPFSDRKFIKVFAEPGVGYRAGGGPFGGYTSAKVLVVFFTDRSDTWVAPYVEFQRRFPFNSPLEGDNRLSIGVMLACVNCGSN